MGNNNTKYYSEEDIKKLLDNGNIILFNNDKIYDVSSYVNIHPGGINNIYSNINNNTNLYYKMHSKLGKKIWNKYLIGYKSK